MFGLKDSDLAQISQVLKRYPDIKEGLIFGSRAMGNYKPGSDVDIALKGHLTSNTLTLVSVELNERLSLPYRFDVVDYTTLTDRPLIDHIDRHGIVFYSL